MKDDFAGWCRIIRDGSGFLEEWEVRHMRDPKAYFFFTVKPSPQFPSITLRRVLLPNVWYPGKGEHNQLIARAFRFLERLKEDDQQPHRRLSP